MNFVTYLIIVLGAVGVIILISTVIHLIIEDQYHDYDDDYDDDDYDDDDDYGDDNDDIYPSKEIVHSSDYDTGDISYEDMILRLTRPGLYSNEWYDWVRRDFSRWAVTQYQEIATFREAMEDAA